MPDESAKSALERIAQTLADHGVDFLVVVGQAEYLFGGNRPTFDVDLCYRRTPDNLRRLAAALQPLKPTLRDAPPGLPFRPDAHTLAMGTNFTFRTDAGDLDLLGHVEPLGGYDQLAPNAETYDLGDFTLRTISLEDLIRVKEHLRREKDRESLRQLLALRELLQQLPPPDPPPPKP
jgi:predicted nucleotidyltransferase